MKLNLAPDEQLVPLVRNGHVFGYIYLDLTHLQVAVNRHVVDRGWGVPARDTSTLSDRVLERGRAIGEWFALDLVHQLATPATTERAGSQSQPSAPAAARAANTRRGIVANLGALALLADFERPAVDVLADTPAVGPVSATGLTFGSYVAMARATGDGAALRAIEQYLRAHNRRGPNVHHDWTKTLDVYNAVRVLLTKLAQAPDRAATWNHPPNEDARVVFEQLDALQRWPDWLKPRPPIRALSIAFVAAKAGVSESTVLKKIKEASKAVKGTATRK